jgi:hypothetical protein
MGAEIKLGQIWRCDGPGNEWEIVSLNPIMGRCKKLGPSFARLTGMLGTVSTFWEDPPGVGWTLVSDAPEAAAVPAVCGKTWDGGPATCVRRPGHTRLCSANRAYAEAMDGAAPPETPSPPKIRRNLDTPEGRKFWGEPGASSVAERRPVVPTVTCIDCDTAPEAVEVPMRLTKGASKPRPICDDCYLKREEYVTSGPVVPRDVPAPSSPWRPGDTAIAANLGRREWRRR